MNLRYRPEDKDQMFKGLHRRDHKWKFCSSILLLREYVPVPFASACKGAVRVGACPSFLAFECTYSEEHHVSQYACVRTEVRVVLLLIDGV